MTVANLQADLGGSDFSKSDLTGASLEGANLEDVNFENVPRTEKLPWFNAIHQNLGGGFKDFLCSALLGEMIQSD